MRQKWQAALGHVLVDEYQDTNATQYTVLKLLVGGPERKDARFTAVGDDDQSIYGWRGATLDNLRQLPIDFPALKVIKLEQNYRSTSAILRAANNVIGPNPKLFPKNLWSDLGEGEPVRVVDADHEEHEAERAVARIQSLRAGTTTTSTGQPQSLELRDFAVLYRANHQARVFEQALRKAQIPYKVSGGQSFFDRAEIKDLCAWFRLWVNNDDDPAFLRAVTTPKRGIGHQTLAPARRVRGQVQAQPVRGPVQLQPGQRAAGARRGQPARIRPLRERPGIPRPPYRRCRRGARLPDRMAERDRLREAPVRRRGQRESCAAARWTNVMEFCDWMAARCGGQIDDTAGVTHVQRGQEPARSGADDLAAVHHQRTRRPTRTSSPCPRCTRPRAWSGRM